MARWGSIFNPRLSSPDEGDNTQQSVSRITIYEFSRSDDGGIIQCINPYNSIVHGMASISVGEWLTKIYAS